MTMENLFDQNYIRTPWYPLEIKPVKAGDYEGRQKNGDVCAMYWDGTNWHVYGAHHMAIEGLVEWRGWLRLKVSLGKGVLRVLHQRAAKLDPLSSHNVMRYAQENIKDNGDGMMSIRPPEPYHLRQKSNDKAGSE